MLLVFLASVTLVILHAADFPTTTAGGVSINISTALLGLSE